MTHTAQSHPLTFRRLLAPDAPAFQQLRLESLHDHPEAFSATWEEERLQPLEWFAKRLENSVVLGAWRGDTLVGIAGLFVPLSPRQRHKNALWGFYVQPQARGAGLAQDLLSRIIGQAATRAEEILLGVAASNSPALRLYKKAGFQEYGLERRALKMGDHYDDVILMSLALPSARPT
ncbi:MAG TPA: GNAT family N-acetyltransferase [Burkholderiaceae bacterium]|nr:GNAT family N-acetyltransferase [Burkholderiaceae bacterium]